MSIGDQYGVPARHAKMAYGVPARHAKMAYGVPARHVKMACAGLALALLFAGFTADAAPGGHVPTLLVFGDSLVAGYGLAHQDGFEAQLQAALQKAGRPVRILDGGVSGDTSAGGRARLDWALADRPDAVLLELGANDALRGTDPAETEANLAAILDQLAAQHIPVLLSGMLAPPNLGASYGRQFAAIYQRLGARPGVIFDPFFLQGVAGDAGLNQADHMHPDPEGVRRVVARILPAVERLLGEVGG
jgi:acyl-CoA thioesterase-1